MYIAKFLLLNPLYNHKTHHRIEWHNHKDVNEIMFVISGEGTIKDKDGIYTYTRGDVFVFPKGEFHEISALGTSVSKFVFIRVFE